MTSVYPLRRLTWTLTALLGIASAYLTCAPARAEDNAEFQQRLFASPDDAIKALRTAVEADDKNELHQIFGPEIKGVATGDPVQDTNNFKAFSKALAEKCEPQSQGDKEVILNIGNDGWPFPIPLMKQDGQWYFDTAAGREEIINRHIGHDELNAIGVCEAFVKAQREYYDTNPDGNGMKHYAQKFKSTPGQMDGLYWKSADTNHASPLSALVAQAHEEGYHHHNATGQQPYHGYFFKILTSQGRMAQGGKMDYVVSGQMTGGFALVAYPDQWDQSGVMTFIVNQDGKIYQRNLGKGTVAKASAMTDYNPSHKWTLVQDKGITENADSTEAAAK